MGPSVLPYGTPGGAPNPAPATRGPPVRGARRVRGHSAPWPPDPSAASVCKSESSVTSAALRGCVTGGCGENRTRRPMAARWARRWPFCEVSDPSVYAAREADARGGAQRPLAPLPPGSRLRRMRSGPRRRQWLAGRRLGRVVWPGAEGRYHWEFRLGQEHTGAAFVLAAPACVPGVGRSLSPGRLASPRSRTLPGPGRVLHPVDPVGCGRKLHDGWSRALGLEARRYDRLA